VNQQYRYNRFLTRRFQGTAYQWSVLLILASLAWISINGSSSAVADAGGKALAQAADNSTSEESSEEAPKTPADDTDSEDTSSEESQQDSPEKSDKEEAASEESKEEESPPSEESDSSEEKPAEEGSDMSEKESDEEKQASDSEDTDKEEQSTAKEEPMNGEEPVEEKKESSTEKKQEPAEEQKTDTEQEGAPEGKEEEVSVEEDRPMEVEPEDTEKPDQPPPEKDSPQEPAVEDVEPKKEIDSLKKRVIGATATVMEKQSELLFRARVDTGAKSCSLHVEKVVIEDESETMADNIGKVIRFQVKNRDDETHWLEGKINGYVLIKTSNSEIRERRYKVPITLRWKDVEKTVLVTLNDRSHMEYPLLLGRNFLLGEFIVDVELNNED